MNPTEFPLIINGELVLSTHMFCPKPVFGTYPLSGIIFLHMKTTKLFDLGKCFFASRDNFCLFEKAFTKAKILLRIINDIAGSRSRRPRLFNFLIQDYLGGDTMLKWTSSYKDLLQDSILGPLFLKTLTLS